MPLILSSDSSGKTASAAVISEEKLIGCFTINTGFTHSEKMMPLIYDMLKNIDIQINDIDAFAVANGPGSFTGLRIGASSIKAIAHTLNKPLFGISTLDGLNRNIPCFNGLVCPIIDARRQEVYTAVYDGNNKLLDDCDIKLSDLLDYLNSGKNIMFLGDGVLSYKDIISGTLGEKAFFAPPQLILQNAASIGLIAMEKYQNGERPEYSQFSLSYLKASQPEQKLSQKEQN